jgi:deoxycytidylate deaminase
MRVLEGDEERLGEEHMQRAIVQARNATCARRHCGAVVVKDGVVLGEGFNSPAGGDRSVVRCQYDKTQYHPKVTDKTCCMHAEVRAMLMALRQYPEKVPGATLFFVSVDALGEKQFSRNPYCTVCSKLALDVGLKEFVLWHRSGITAYNTAEYNELSYAYTEQAPEDVSGSNENRRG